MQMRSGKGDSWSNHLKPHTLQGLGAVEYHGSKYQVLTVQVSQALAGDMTGAFMRLILPPDQELCVSSCTCQGRQGCQPARGH